MHLTYRKKDSKIKPAEPAEAGDAGAPDDDGSSLFSTEELCTIDVTPEMIEAGIDEFGLFDWCDPAEYVVPMIYRAMELQRRRFIKAMEEAAQSQPDPTVEACSRS